VEAKPSPAEDLIEIEFPDGRREQLTRQQIRDGYLRQQDYTRKTQEIAEHRKQLAPIAEAYQQLATEREQIGQLFQNPQLLAQWAAQNYGPQYAQLVQQALTGQMPAGASPDDIVTAQQAALIAQQQAAVYAQQLEQRVNTLQQQLEGRTQQIVQKGIQELETSQEVAKQSQVIDAHITSLFNQHPILSAVPEMEDALRFRVFSREPQTADEALRFFTEEADRQAKVLESKFNEINKRVVVEKTKLATHGIEPPGGAGVQPEPRQFRTKNGDIDWKGLSGAATDFMNQRKG
jgi:hypothetical protein